MSDKLRVARGFTTLGDLRRWVLAQDPRHDRRSLSASVTSADGRHEYVGRLTGVGLAEPASRGDVADLGRSPEGLPVVDGSLCPRHGTRFETVYLTAGGARLCSRGDTWRVADGRWEAVK